MKISNKRILFPSISRCYILKVHNRIILSINKRIYFLKNLHKNCDRSTPYNDVDHNDSLYFNDYQYQTAETHGVTKDHLATTNKGFWGHKAYAQQRLLESKVRILLWCVVSLCTTNFVRGRFTGDNDRQERWLPGIFVHSVVGHIIQSYDRLPDLVVIFVRIRRHLLQWHLLAQMRVSSLNKQRWDSILRCNLTNKGYSSDSDHILIDTTLMWKHQTFPRIEMLFHRCQLFMFK